MILYYLPEKLISVFCMILYYLPEKLISDFCFTQTIV